jgi:hypothetical protein
MKRLLLLALALALCVPAFGQQKDINRYALFTGFDYLISPARNLTARGLEGDFGVIVKPWLGLGGDFAVVGDKLMSGAGTINGTETIFAPILNAAGPPVPMANQVNVPFRSTTYIFAAGPQFYLRKWDKVTFFVRPGFGGIHERADLTLPTGIGPLLQLLGQTVPNSKQTDTTWFIGVGGGFDLNVSRPVAIRFAADFVNTHLFSNLLTQRQNYSRLSVGPVFRWGQLK